MCNSLVPAADEVTDQRQQQQQQLQSCRFAFPPGSEMAKLASRLAEMESEHGAWNGAHNRRPADRLVLPQQMLLFFPSGGPAHAWRL